MVLTRAERNRRYAERKRRGLIEPRPRLVEAARPPRDPRVRLAAMLGPLPKLPGALCRGRSRWFDEAEAGEDLAAVVERHERAAALCQLCPVLDPCTRWAASLPPRQRPPGVLAGTIPNSPGGSHE